VQAFVATVTGHALKMSISGAAEGYLS
jgi:hypothetical protein